MASGPTSPDKLPFDKLISRIPNGLLKRELGLRREGKKEVLNPTFTKLPAVLSRALRCGVEKLGDYINLPPQRVSDVISAAAGNREGQIHFLLLAWVELRGEKATVEALLRALYDADDTKAIEEVAKGMSDPDFQRAIPASKKLNFLAPADGTSGPPSVQSMQEQPQKNFLEGEETQTILPKRVANLTVDTKMAPERLESQSEQTPVELPPDVSLQKPLEESHVQGTSQPAIQSDKDSDPGSKEPQKPMEESQLISSGGHVGPSAVVAPTTTFENPRVATAVSDVTIEEKQQHELVSGDRRMERMQSEIDSLQQHMKRVEKNMEELSLEHRRESLHQTNKNKEWEAKLNKLEKENEALKSNVTDLEKQLKEVNEKLMEALAKVAKLEEDNEELREENVQLQAQNDALQRKVADTEKEKAEVVDSNDKLQEINTQLKGTKERLELELQEKNERIQSLERRAQEYETQEMTDSNVGSGRQSLAIQGSNSGQWTCEKRLGTGGYGEVFLAKKQGSGECYAAKRITCRDSAAIEKQQESVSSFFKEMKVLQDCRHRRVVRYVDRFIEHDKDAIHFFLVMEYMRQGSLADMLKKKGKLEEMRARRYTRQVLEGLQYLHGEKIIHRDVKCSNILLDENGDIKLADFGCVKFLESSVSSGEHLTGTAWWMAPEIVPKGKQSGTATEKSDVWSVGATVVEMLTGQRPFHQYEEKMSVIFGLGMKTLSLEKLISAPGYSNELQEFLRLCIAWEPSERATVQELLCTPFCTVSL